MQGMKKIKKTEKGGGGKKKVLVPRSVILFIHGGNPLQIDFLIVVRKHITDNHLDSYQSTLKLYGLPYKLL